MLRMEEMHQMMKRVVDPQDSSNELLVQRVAVAVALFAQGERLLSRTSRPPDRLREPTTEHSCQTFSPVREEVSKCSA